MSSVSECFNRFKLFIYYLWFFEPPSQCQVPGSEGRQSPRWSGGGQTPDPAGEPSALCHAEAGGPGNTRCLARVGHPVASSPHVICKGAAVCLR